MTAHVGNSLIGLATASRLGPQDDDDDVPDPAEPPRIDSLSDPDDDDVPNPAPAPPEDRSAAPDDDDDDIVPNPAPPH